MELVQFEHEFQKTKIHKQVGYYWIQRKFDIGVFRIPDEIAYTIKFGKLYRVYCQTRKDNVLYAVGIFEVF